MDNLTHSLVGVLLSRAGLDRFTPHSAALCVIAANVPDVDIFAGLDPETYLIYHRHLTHSLFMVPAMAGVAALLTLGWIWIRERLHRASSGLVPPTLTRMWVVALIPTLSHPLLDLTNSYGVRLWLPLSGRWSSWDAVFIIDLVVWAILLCGVAAPWASRARRRIGIRAAAVALAALFLYIAVGAAMRAYIVNQLAQRRFDGAEVLSVAAFPAPPDPLSWSAYVQTSGFDLWLPIDILRLKDVRTSDGRKFRPSTGSAEIDAAWQTGLGRAYRQFAQYPYEIVSPAPEGAEVVLGDFRFLRNGRPGFLCVVRIDQALRVISARFEF